MILIKKVIIFCILTFPWIIGVVFSEEKLSQPLVLPELSPMAVPIHKEESLKTPETSNNNCTQKIPYYGLVLVIKFSSC